MTDELKRRLDDELPKGPVPFGLDMDGLVTAGRRGRRFRALAIGGGSVTAVAAVSAVAIFAASVGTAGDPAPAAGPKNVTQPEVTLPELDPDKTYEWSPLFWDEDIERTEATEAYTEALRSVFDELYPGIDFDQEGMFGGGGEPEVVDIVNTLSKVTEVVDEGSYDVEPIHSQPLYETSVEGENNTTVAPYALFPGAEFTERLDMQVWPAGGFTTGTDGPTDLIDCESTEYQSDFEGKAIEDITCTETTGPNGELIRQAVASTSHSGTGATYWRVHTTVVYRTDGTAVVIENQVAKEDEDTGDALADLGDRAPAMSLEDQITVALALPNAIVE
ncbi:hypothetical protein [Stackebrandtia soli]|uniref:hypothetical protein n=1 Tax=Stackebrandtia soli TaxID=1892856 RepID=UPI0039E9A79C